MAIPTDTLFVACTRPAMKWGVPYEGFVVNFFGTFLITVIIVGSPVGFAAGIVIHFVIRELARVDPYFFHKWKMFYHTKLLSRTGAIWGGSRLQPSLTRTRRASDMATYV